ncbi:MAG: winged helix DNA-binding protein [Euryarchaeota archaeon]|nr:winged helix DNA-binding protein [Euryarchaeota archaeon]
MSAADLLLHEKPRKVLRFIRRKRNVSINDVAQSTDTAYAHTFNLIKKLADAGIVKTSRAGRRVEVSVTERGRKICRLIDEIERLAEGSAEEVNSSTEKLERYREKVRELASGGCRNACMLLGRYRQIVRRMRPRGREARELRRQVLEEIEDALCRMKR